MPGSLRAGALALVYYPLALSLAVFVIANANDASRAYASVSAHESVSAKADRALREALEAFSLGLYDGGTELDERLADTVDVARYHDARANGGGWLLLGLSLVFLFIVVAREHRGQRSRSAAIVRNLFGVSSVFLLVGLLAPILTVVVREDVALLGRIVLQYESKGIITTIHKLFVVGNYFIAILLLLFSVILPVVKIVLSLVALGVTSPTTHRLSVALIKGIGRWSMTDVFVVGVLLAFLTADTAQLTDATLGPGLYFFAGYGLLSIAAGQMMIGYEGRANGGSVTHHQ